MSAVTVLSTYIRFIFIHRLGKSPTFYHVFKPIEVSLIDVSSNSIRYVRGKKTFCLFHRMGSLNSLANLQVTQDAMSDMYNSYKVFLLADDLKQTI